MDDSEWLEALVVEITRKHRVILDSDDPILISAILNKEIIDQNLTRYQEMLETNQKSLAFQLDTQKKLNEELFSQVVERLINSTKELQLAQSLNQKSVDSHSKFESLNIGILSLVFMVGLVLGIGLAKFV